jgi:hypothetical protein
MREDLQKPQGCLSERSIRLLRSESRLSPELAGHVASCPACQRRALALDDPRDASKKARPPSLRRVFIYMGVIVALAMLAFGAMVSRSYLSGRSTGTKAPVTEPDSGDKR